MSREFVENIAAVIFLVLLFGGITLGIASGLARVLLLARVRKVDRALFDRLGGWRTLNPNGSNVSSLSYTTSLDRFIDDESYVELPDRRARQFGIICTRTGAIAKFTVVLVVIASVGLIALHSYA